VSAKNEKIDRDALHRLLFERVNHRGQVEVRGLEFGQEIGVRTDHVRRILGDMAAAGRIKQVRRSYRGTVWSVRDPEEWRKERGPQGRRRRPVWG
jgi:hypothetical protein